MSGFETVGNDVKKKFEQAADNPFFNFSKPYLDFIGGRKIFDIVYIIMAVTNLLFPVIIIFKVIGANLFRFGAKYTIAFILSWIVIAFACWIGFQLWWDRLKKISKYAESEFIATPVFSEIIQTFGEWLGTLTGIIGAGVGLIASIFLGQGADLLFSAIGMDFMGVGIMGILIGPVTGFFIIVISHFLAEQLRLLVSLVISTKEIAVNQKKYTDGA